MHIHQIPLTPLSLLVNWPDELPTTSMVFHNEEPKCVLRFERIPEGLRVSPLRCGEEFTRQLNAESGRIGFIVKIARWFKLNPANITLELQGAGITPEFAVAYDPRIELIKIINLMNLQEIPGTEISKNKAYEFHLKCFIRRHFELYKKRTNKTPVPTKSSEIIVTFQDDSDFNMLRDPKKHPKTLHAWKCEIQEIINQAKNTNKPLPNVRTIDGSEYLKWLAKNKLPLNLDTQTQFAKSILPQQTKTA
jgi:hypothetical protein